ncbi:MAG: hypothetical protein JSR77_17480 [Planctomycetes bacterium]|nr:hypothetical protein [Planctomycetota bacterium]
MTHAAWAVAACMGGCGVPTIAPEPGIGGDPPSIVVRGDWDDLDAAAVVASKRTSLAILESTSGETQRTFTYLASDDVEFELTARREGDRIAASARGVQRRDLARERDLLSVFARRVHDLAGVEFAPNRDPAPE